MKWIKASASNAHGNCVELAPMVVAGRALIEMRDSKDPAAGLLVFTQAEIAAFFAGVKAGEFDHLAG